MHALGRHPRAVHSVYGVVFAPFGLAYDQPRTRPGKFPSPRDAGRIPLPLTTPGFRKLAGCTASVSTAPASLAT